MVCWAHERWHDGWLSVELSLLSQLPLLELSVHTSSLWSRACMSVLCVRVCLCCAVGLWNIWRFKAPQHFHLKVKQMDKHWRRYRGFSSKPLDATLILCVIYMHVSHTRDLSSSAGLSFIAIASEDVICNKNLPGFWAWVKRKLNGRGFLNMGTLKSRRTLHSEVY